MTWLPPDVVCGGSARSIVLLTGLVALILAPNKGSSCPLFPQPSSGQFLDVGSSCDSFLRVVPSVQHKALEFVVLLLQYPRGNRLLKALIGFSGQYLAQTSGNAMLDFIDFAKLRRLVQFFTLDAVAVSSNNGQLMHQRSKKQGLAVQLQ